MTLDLATATLDDLDNISLDDILGGDVSQIDLMNTFPDCTVVVVITGYEKLVMPAKPEENKKARIDIKLQFKIMRVLACTTPNVDADTLVGRTYTETVPVSLDFGRVRLVRLLLGACGVPFADKAAQKQLASSGLQLLEALIDENLQFGIQIATKASRNTGYVNTRFLDKESSFISHEKLIDMLVEG